MSSEVLSPPTDEALMQKVQHGDEHAFSELYQRYEKPMRGFLSGFLGDAHLAEDVLQETFVNVHRKSQTFSEDGKVKPWLYSIAQRRGIDFHRQAARRPAMSLDHTPGHKSEAADGEPMNHAGNIVSHEDSPSDHLLASERSERVQQALCRLPPKQRRVLDLYYFRDMKYREIAQECNSSIITIKSRIAAAKKKLRSVLGQFPDLTEDDR